MYKIIQTTGYPDQIHRKSDGAWIPKDHDNTDYQKFIQDVNKQGLDVVEGPDIVTPNYKESRQNEYPPIAEQLDQLYWDLKNGRLDTGDWIQNITKIKLKHSKSNTGTTTIGEIPQWVITEGTGNYP